MTGLRRPLYDQIIDMAVPGTTADPSGLRHRQPTL